MRRLELACAAALLSACLAACGAEEGRGGTAADTAADTAPTSPSPTVGTYPSFEPEDYTFELVVQCFCTDAGTPIEITVVDAEVVGAVYGLADGGGGGGAAPGEAADASRWLTIDDVIDRANDTEAARIDVEWPEGQAYPDRVYVDADERAADDETGYEISEVEVG